MNPKSILLMLVPVVGSMAPAVASAADPGPCSSWRDVGSDGRVDTRTEYLYEGELLIAEVVLAVRGGRPLAVTEYVYDRNDRLWGKAVDRNDDGVSDLNVYFTYDTRGRLSGEALDDGADGTFDRFVYYTYQGNNRSASVDLDGNGRIDRRDVATYRMLGGNVASETLDQGADGRADRVTTYIYDAGDNRVYELVDDGADGSTDVVLGFVYDCW